MQLVLVRDTFNDDCTLGALTAGPLVVETLEDKVREIDGEPVLDWKVKGQTAIPRGEYEVFVTYSNRFGKYTPELQNVPGFSGIRIHAGNTSADTEGCILVGLDRGDRSITNSRLALAELSPIIEAATGRMETVTIIIS